MNKILIIFVFCISVLVKGQTVWGGHFNIEKIDSQKIDVELVIQADLGFPSVINVGLCISDSVMMLPDTMSLTLDTNYIYQHESFLPAVEILYYRGVLDLTGASDSTWVLFKFIHCCRPVNINSFWGDNWAWGEAPMFMTVASMLMLPDSIQQIGSSIRINPIPIWFPVDTLSIVSIPKTDTTAFIDTWFYYQAKLSGNGDPCCTIHSVISNDSCNGQPSVWVYNSLNSMSTYSNNNSWAVNNLGQTAQIQWNPNQIGNIARGFMFYNDDGFSSRPTYTFRTYDRSLWVPKESMNIRPVYWEIWDITGRLVYSGDDWVGFKNLPYNTSANLILISKVTLENGMIEWSKINYQN